MDQEAYKYDFRSHAIIKNKLREMKVEVILSIYIIRTDDSQRFFMTLTKSQHIGIA